MRFRAKLATEQVNALHALIIPIARLTGSGKQSDNGMDNAASSLLLSQITTGTMNASVIHLDPEHLRISVRSGRGDADGIACFAELTCSKIFMEHRIESAANDAIVFEIDLHMFKTALQSILQLLSSSSSSSSNSTKRSTGNQTALHNSSMNHHNHTITMKLAKRAGFPCLCLSVTSNQTLQHKLEQNHSVPIKVMRTAEMQYHLPPHVSQPDVQLELPSDLTGRKGSVRTVVERLKSISPHVFVEGSMTGDLVLRIEGTEASIRTFYNKLIPRFEDTKSSQNTDATCVLKVDSKKLHACFQWRVSLASGRIVSSAVLCTMRMRCWSCMFCSILETWVS